jgi:hypothetical protein
VQSSLVRPAEVDLLVGDPSKAHRNLKWRPEIRFEGLVRMMVRSDLALLQKRMMESLLAASPSGLDTNVCIPGERVATVPASLPLAPC